jgi:hypothetical protein
VWVLLRCAVGAVCVGGIDDWIVILISNRVFALFSDHRDCDRNIDVGVQVQFDLMIAYGAERAIRKANFAALKLCALRRTHVGYIHGANRAK